MPAFDSKGPAWSGIPGAGWRLGPCPLGLRRWHRQGRGFGRFFFSSQLKGDERTQVQEYIKVLEKELSEVKNYLKDLTK